MRNKHFCNGLRSSLTPKPERRASEIKNVLFKQTKKPGNEEIQVEKKKKRRILLFQIFGFEPCLSSGDVVARITKIIVSFSKGLVGILVLRISDEITSQNIL